MESVAARKLPQAGPKMGSPQLPPRPCKLPLLISDLNSCVYTDSGLGGTAGLAAAVLVAVGAAGVSEAALEGCKLQAFDAALTAACSHVGKEGRCVAAAAAAAPGCEASAWGGRPSPYACCCCCCSWAAAAAVVLLPVTALPVSVPPLKSSCAAALLPLPACTTLALPSTPPLPAPLQLLPPPLLPVAAARPPLRLPAAAAARSAAARSAAAASFDAAELAAFAPSFDGQHHSIAIGASAPSQI